MRQPVDDLPPPEEKPQPDERELPWDEEEFPDGDFSPVKDDDRVD